MRRSEALNCYLEKTWEVCKKCGIAETTKPKRKRRKVSSELQGSVILQQSLIPSYLSNVSYPRQPGRRIEYSI